MPHTEQVEPDVHSSSEAYANRFRGPLGEYLLDVQARGFERLIQPWRGGTVLDVGGGHAQLAPMLLSQDMTLTIQGSSAACRERPDRVIGRESYDFLEASLLNLPVADRSFDVVVCARIIAHVPEPSRFLAELCRVARHAVIVDYPDRSGFNRFSRMLFGCKSWVEQRTTRPFAYFDRREIEAWLGQAGFAPDAHVGQFFWPVALHRLIGRAGTTRLLEQLAWRLGLTRRLGSPVILRALRADD